MESQHTQPELAGRPAPKRRVVTRVRTARIAWSLWAVTITLVAGGLLLGLANRPEAFLYEFWVVALIGPTFATLGALIVSWRPGNFIGWIFCVPGAIGGLQMFSGQYATVALLSETSRWPGGALAAWLSTLTQTLVVSSIFFLVLLFPTGRLPSPRWRVVAWTSGLVIAAWVISRAFHPGPLEDFPSAENPFGVEVATVLDALEDVGSWAGPACFVAVIVSLALRFYRSRGEERLQLKWFAYAATLGFLAILLGGEGPLGTLVWTIAPLSLPVAAGVAILKYRLYDIDFVINRTLVYGTLTACVVAVYIVVVGYLGALFQAQDNLVISLLAAGLVAVLFAPLRDRLQRGVNHLMYGERDEPYKVLSGLGERMENVPEPDSVLPNIAQTVAQTLKLPHVVIRLQQNGEGLVEAARYGERPTAEPLVLPLTYRKEAVGELVLSPRAGSDAFSHSEVELLEALARQIGVAAHAAKLNEDLQRSRERLVVAHEEERRRLRRDLHDGVGPQLAALMLELETASDLFSDNPEASALMAKLSDRARDTVSDVRRAVHALRPPALDELGLVGALREVAGQYSRGGLRVSVEAPDKSLPLPAAVEVACYRITQEAMTNMVRHAEAGNCWVRIALDEEAGVLHVEVEDDGRGIGENDRAGVGMSSMRERAEELGGSCTVGPSSGGGTLVRALLPCPPANSTVRGEE